MKDNLAKLIENTLKDILLANAALTFIFAIPMAIISRHGMGITIWFITVLIAPALCAVGAWLVSRTSGHAEEFFHRRWAKEGANKQVISSQADSLIKISRIWADFFPANTSNQPI